MKKNNNAEYLDRVYSWGNKWNIFVMLVLLAFPFAVALIFKAIPNWNGLFKGLIATAPMYWAVGVVEVITYIPMLGVGGSYLSFVTGNISNLKLPCALGALEQANVKADTEEGEVISTIAIAVSSIVTTVIIILGVLLIIPLQPILQSEILQPCFEQILPALFGGLGIVFISKKLENCNRADYFNAYTFYFYGFRRRRCGNYGAGRRAFHNSNQSYYV